MLNYPIKINPCKPSGSSSSYDRQDWLVRDHQVPFEILEGDETHRYWSDREHNGYATFEKARDILRKKFNYAGVESGIPKLSLKEFIEVLRMFSEPYRPFTEDDGGRIVLFTNVSTGYELYAIDIFWRGKDNPPFSERLLSDTPKDVNTIYFHDYEKICRSNTTKKKRIRT